MTTVPAHDLAVRALIEAAAGPLLFKGAAAAAYLWSELAAAGTRGPA